MRRHITSRTWRAEDVQLLKTLVASGVSAARASVALKRSILSVKAKAKESGFPFPDERDLKRERLGLPPLNKGGVTRPKPLKRPRPG
jgi:hypothetical protein